MKNFDEPQSAQADAPINQELCWLFTHCRAIGMTKKSYSGLMQDDIALFTADLTDRIDALLLAGIEPEAKL